VGLSEIASVDFSEVSVALFSIRVGGHFVGGALEAHAGVAAGALDFEAAGVSLGQDSAFGICALSHVEVLHVHGQELVLAHFGLLARSGGMVDALNRGKST
jgi:hypothetical protein